MKRNLLAILVSVALVVACTQPAAEAASESEERVMVDSKGRQYEVPSDSELRDRLSQMQYRVTQRDGTEPAFSNEYWDNKEPGLYVDVVTGEPLFSSIDKFKSGTGWPSFTKPVDEEYVVSKRDFKLLIPRTEVRSKYGDSHLGHVFKDGPAPTGLRYCVNSAALRFIPVDRLEEEGYGEYKALFEEKSEGESTQ